MKPLYCFCSILVFFSFLGKGEGGGQQLNFLVEDLRGLFPAANEGDKTITSVLNLFIPHSLSFNIGI